MASKGQIASFSTLTGCVISPCPLWEKAHRSVLWSQFADLTTFRNSHQFSNLQPKRTLAQLRQSTCINKVWRVL